MKGKGNGREKKNEHLFDQAHEDSYEIMDEKSVNWKYGVFSL